MKFKGEIGLYQRRMAECLDGMRRRLEVLRALELQTEQEVLDLGCGGGHLVREIALAVGPNGRTIGVDSSVEQLQVAQDLCAGLSSIALMQMDATDLSLNDAGFDAVASIQMLEYVRDVDLVLSEARRVMKPGGRAVLVSVLWDHWRFHGAEQRLNDLMHDTWRSHCPHQMLPLEMPAKLVKAGFGGISQRPIAFLNGNMHENAFSFWAARLVASFAIERGVDRDQTALWLQQLSDADRDGCFGFVSVPVMTTAIAL